jgi:glycosyltransferase involved in cell wall biosynthesis
MGNLDHKPVISIGMPIWNCAATISSSIQSVLNQSYENWELLISDNHSTDGTFEIVNGLVESEPRIKVVRQDQNRGGWANFLFVFNSSEGIYFKFHAGDDCLSRDYLESIVAGFRESPGSIGFCTPDKWDNQGSEQENRNRFDFSGSQVVRLNKLQKNCWKSNGVFYGVYKKDALSRAITQDLFRSKIQILDWLILAKLLKEGEIKRTSSGLLTLGSNGASNSNPFAWFNQLHGFWNKTLPYKGFLKLFKEGDLHIPKRARAIIVFWMLDLTLKHFKGLLRLGLHRIRIKRLPG